jgi:hypothetical protein
MDVSVEVAFEFLKLALAALAGGFVSYRFQRRAEAEKRRREYVLSKLEASFHLVIEAMEHQGVAVPPSESFERRQKLARAINTLELFASPEVRNSARSIAEKLNSEEPWVPYEPLARKLRDAFRKEMGLEGFRDEVKSLHIYRIVPEDPLRSKPE